MLMRISAAWSSRPAWVVGFAIAWPLTCAAKGAPPAPGAAHAAAAGTPVTVDLDAEWRRQYDDLARQFAERDWFAGIADQVLRRDALVLPADRDPTDVVVRRTEALLEDIRRLGPKGSLDEAARELKKLAARVGQSDPGRAEERYQLFAELCRVRRKIALANPLLDFDDILFVTRHGTTARHMCDQFFGMTGLPPSLGSGKAGPLPGVNAGEAHGGVALVKVYDGLKPWPAGTTIKALRIVQYLSETRQRPESGLPRDRPRRSGAGTRRPGDGPGRAGRQRPLPHAAWQGGVLPGPRQTGSGRDSASRTHPSNARKGGKEETR